MMRGINVWIMVVVTLSIFFFGGAPSKYLNTRITQFSEIGARTHTIVRTKLMLSL